MSKLRYKRVVLKLSGESLCSGGSGGFDTRAADYLTGEIQAAVEAGAEIALVIGAGNLLRGKDLQDNPAVARPTADTMGMLATVMNALALRDVLVARGVPACVLSALAMPSICQTYRRRRAMRYLSGGHVTILAGGTGNPFFTTDTGAALRACELAADAVLKATKGDGVFDSEPEIHPTAKKYDRLTYQKVLEDRLGVMDFTAVSMCRDNDIPVIVFSFSKPGNLAAALTGQAVGSLIRNEP